MAFFLHISINVERVLDINTNAARVIEGKRTMKFWKMNGAGNDFILINNIEEQLPSDKVPEMVRTICERHMSIGADGVMLIDKPSKDYVGKADYRMLFYNSDGSSGEMCGNGARCICRYGYETGLSGDIQKVETTAGLVTGKRIDERLYRVRLNDPGNYRFDEEVEAEGKIFVASYVELGSPGIPHIAVPMTNLKEIEEGELLRIGRSLRYNPTYPKGCNVNFYEIIGEDYLYERTYERGVEDFTYACGTGTGSVVTSLTRQGKVSGKNTRVDMRGGTLYIDVVRDENKVTDLYLTGPTNIVCKGEIFDEDLVI